MEKNKIEKVKVRVEELIKEIKKKVEEDNILKSS